MAKVVGTDETDFIWVSRGWFDRDGATDGDDTIYGLGGDDWIEGGDGNDILQGGEGADRLFGGDDIDTAIYSDSPVGVSVNLQTGHGYWGTAQGDTLWNIENLTGSLFGDDFLTGNANDNVLSGLGGDDHLQGNAGADILDGGWGNDKAYYQDSAAGVTVNLLWGSASGGDAEGDKLISIESLYGSDHDDGLFGDNGANVLQGAGGDDTLLGFDDADLLEGGAGKDSLHGGGGNDTLTGGPDGDTLVGGPGADTFKWYWSPGSYDSGGLLNSGQIDYTTIDVVLDFNYAEGDRIEITNLDPPWAVPFQNFTFIGEYFAAGGFTAPGQVAYISDGIDTYLDFNTDGVFTLNNLPDFEFAIRFSGQYTPDASWFVNL
jgi:Ca2+-binding RTX toxin-like protein